MTEEIHDHSRVDAFMAARRRAMLLNASWRPMAAGAVGAALVIGAVWVTLPKFSTREVIVDRVVSRDVQVDRIVPHDVTINNPIPRDVEILIPRIVVTSPAPTTPAEKAFVGSNGWREAVIRGRIVREDHNGFVMLTGEGEQSFFPAKVTPSGKIELDPSTADRVEDLLGDLGYCRPLPTGVYECIALHGGVEVPIRQTPITTRQGRPA